MAGGYKTFGPTYNATKFVRVMHEGMINGNHNISESIVSAKTEDLAGRIAAITADGVGLANAGEDAVGLFVEDLGDMVNASEKASFYFRGGEYYISIDRMGTGADAIQAGDELTTDAEGKLVKVTGSEKVVAIATTAAQAFTMGNMYEHAGDTANGGKFVGIILYV